MTCDKHKWRLSPNTPPYYFALWHVSLCGWMLAPAPKKEKKKQIAKQTNKHSAVECFSPAHKRTTTSDTNKTLKGFLSSWHTFFHGSRKHFIVICVSQQWKRDTQNRLISHPRERSVQKCFYIANLCRCMAPMELNVHREGKKNPQIIFLILTANYCVAYKVLLYYWNKYTSLLVALKSLLERYLGRAY